MGNGTKAFAPPSITDYTWDTWILGQKNVLAQAPATTDRDVLTDVVSLSFRRLSTKIISWEMTRVSRWGLVSFCRLASDACDEAGSERTSSVELHATWIAAQTFNSNISAPNIIYNAL